MRLIALACVTCVVFGADAAQAQSSSTFQRPPAPPPPALRPAYGLPTASSFDEEIFRRNQTNRAFQNASPARRSRAERIAEMINAGDCTGAHALAVQENDRRLARRVAQICNIDS